MMSSTVDRSYKLLETLIDKSPQCHLLSTYLCNDQKEGSVGAILEILDTLTSIQLDLFWSKMNELSLYCVDELGWTEETAVDEQEHMRGSGKHIALVKTLIKIVHIASKFLDSSKSRPRDLFSTICTFHDILTQLDSSIDDEAALQGAISKLCEYCWINKEQGCELQITQLIPYLLLSAVEQDANDVFVKRLSVIKPAFQLLDFDDESIESIRALLLRCFVHPRFLKTAEGRRFLSYTFTFHKDLQQLAVEVIKPQLATGNGGLAAAYGDVLLRAWRETEEFPPLRQTIEDLCQSLAYDSIHASSQKYFQGLREMLRVFHDSKRIKEVDALLLRMYGPILWRSLRCANPLVRVQASTLFFDVFPIQEGNPTSTLAADNDILLQRQFDLIKTLLEDGDHRVRAVAASGCCRVLRDFWEAVPPGITHQMLSYIAGKLGSDTASAIVRLSVVHGLNELLDNPRSHATMKSLLPAIANMLHDNSDKVRAGFVKILNKVKTIRGFHFYEIIPVETLLTRLSLDEHKPLVCEAITELMLNSYYPTGEAAGPVQAERCLAFLSQNETAALIFYSYFNKFTSVGSAVKMSVLLLDILEEAVSGNGMISYLTASTDGNVLSGEAEGENQRQGNKKTRPRSENTTKLLERAKRRREVEVKKNNQSLSQGGMMIRDSLFRSVMKLMHRILSSVSSKLMLANHVPSREMVAQYFTLPKLAELLPRVLARCSDERDVVMNATYFIQIVEIVSTIFGASSKLDVRKDNFCPTVTSAHTDLSSLCLSSFFGVVSECCSAIEMKHKWSGLCNFVPLAHATIGAICGLRCEDLLVSLVKSVGGAENVLSTPMDWSPVAKGRAALVTVDAKGFCILLSASLNSSDNSVQQGFREKLATNEAMKKSLNHVFSRVRNAVTSYDATPSFLNETLLELVHLSSVYATLVYTMEQSGYGEALSSTCDWIFGDVTTKLAEYIRTPEAICSVGSSPDVAKFLNVISVVLLPLTDLLACGTAVIEIGTAITTWLNWWANSSFCPAATIHLWQLFKIIGRACSLFLTTEATEMQRGGSCNRDVVRSAREAWEACLKFLIDFTFSLDEWETNDLATAASIKFECKQTITSMLQFIFSREKLQEISKDFIKILVLSLLSEFENDKQDISKKSLCSCITSKSKVVDAVVEALKSISNANRDFNESGVVRSVFTPENGNLTTERHAFHSDTIVAVMKALTCI